MPCLAWGLRAGSATEEATSMGGARGVGPAPARRQEMQRLIALLGKPASRSLSPKMQNAAFLALGLDLHYMAFEVEEEWLADAVRGLRALGFAGANVTIPHKTRIMDYLDEVKPGARAIGAVNTIAVVEGRHLVGYNTDAPGLLGALAEDAGFRPRGRKALVLGAGGASRGAAYGLLEAGLEKLVICNRTASRAEEIVDDLLYAFPGREIVAARFPAEKGEAIPASGIMNLVQEFEPDLVVGTIPATAYSWSEALKPGHVPPHPELTVCDLAYSNPPSLTPLIVLGKAMHARTVTGLSVLLHQGARSFEIWTGLPAPVEEMRGALWDTSRGK